MIKVKLFKQYKDGKTPQEVEVVGTNEEINDLIANVYPYYVADLENYEKINSVEDVKFNILTDVIDLKASEDGLKVSKLTKPSGGYFPNQ